MAHLFQPDPKMMREADLGAYAHVPFLLTDGLEYLDVPNRYLRERAVGDWSPQTGARSLFGRRAAISDNSISAYASDLQNALSYLDYVGRSWRQTTPEDVAAYEGAMSDGAWSVDGAALSRETVQRRRGTLSDFLTFACAKGLRPPPDPSVANGAGVLRRVAPTSRKSARRRSPQDLRLPTTAEVRTWLREVRVRCGPARALACRSVIQTGMRLEEVALLRANQVPDLDDRLAELASMSICYGTKGQRRPGDVERRGKRRTLRFLQAFHADLVDHKQLARPLALKTYREHNPGAPLPKAMFLCELSGAPLSTGALYRAWHESPALPFAGFSPHLGRHVFACQTIIALMEREFALIERSIDVVPSSMVMEHARNIIDVHLRPVMGHVSRETTEIYLKWLGDHLYARGDYRTWSRFLDGDDE